MSAPVLVRFRNDAPLIRLGAEIPPATFWDELVSDLILLDAHSSPRRFLLRAAQHAGLFVSVCSWCLPDRSKTSGVISAQWLGGQAAISDGVCPACAAVQYPRRSTKEVV